MIFKKLVFNALIMLVLGLTGLRAQEAIPSSGGNASGSEGSVSYTIGQVVYTTAQGSDGTVTQGVQQPYKISVVTDIDEDLGISIDLTAYPNPTTDFLKLKIEGDIPKQCVAILFSMTGQLIKTQNIEASLTEIDMQSLISAAYFLKVYTQGNSVKQQELKTFKIIKR